MKLTGKRAISILLALVLMLALLPFCASAADVKASTIAKAYKDVINSSNTFRYTNKPVAFWDLNYDTIPEMMVWTENTSNGSLTDIKVWSYQNSSAKIVGTITWGMASSSAALFINTSGRLVSYGVTTSDNRSRISQDVYSFSNSGGLQLLERSVFSIEYDRNNSWREASLSCEVNGVAVSNSEAQARRNSLGKDVSIVLMGDDIFSSFAVQSMSKSDASSYLGGIDQFFDVAGSMFYAEPVKWAGENGIAYGTGGYSFLPDLTCSRAQILTMLWRAAGSPPANINNPFLDVSAGDWYYQAALWAYRNGIVSGSAFGGDTPCTRAATVTYIWRSKGSPSAGLSAFSDVPRNASYSTAVQWAVENGITNGVGNNKFSPESTCTRGQIVTFLYRARNINASMSNSQKWSEAYKTFLFVKDYLSAGQYYVQGGFPNFISLYDMDQDGTPELIISSGVFAGPDRCAYIYTYTGSKVVYIGQGPTDRYYNKNDRFGIFENLGASYLRYQKNENRIDKVEINGQTWPGSMTPIMSSTLDRIMEDGWDSFVRNAGL